MIPRRLFRAGTLCRLASPLILLMVATALPAFAQDDTGLLRMTILMPDTDELYRNHTAGHRSYVELDALHFTISATNESTVPVVVDEAKFREAVKVSLGASGQVPVTLDWLTIRQFGTDTPTTTSGRDVLQINPSEMLTWNVAIRRLDTRRFIWGEYSVALTLADLRQALSTPTGAAWRGRVLDGTYQRLVSIEAPQTPGENVRRWAIEAGAASLRGDYESALQAWTRAAAIDPRVQGRLPRLYVLTGRYKEAVAAYEQLASRGELSGLELNALAEAYIAVGAEAKAFNALLQSGVSQESVADEIANMRQRISDRAINTRR